MTESIGLASAAEIPLVIVNVQRCGPSTGIPSKSEQSDLSHALWGGHGDAPRVVLAPYDTEGCCRLMMESIGIAERYQTPVILLSDQWLGQTFAAVREDFLGESRPVSQRKRPPEEEAGPYRRYEITDDSISPWASAGDAGYVHQITGLNHAEDGAPAFDAETQLRMHEKIRRKLTPLADRRDLVKIFGDEGCTRGVVTWGSTAQPVLSTIRELGLADRVRVCIPELIHPLPTGLTEFLKSMDRLLVIEMNHSGQLYRYLRSEVNLPEDSRVYSRPGGRPFSVTELTGPIKGVAE